jgi:hypothetical protein
MGGEEIFFATALRTSVQDTLTHVVKEIVPPGLHTLTDSDQPGESQLLRLA